MHYYRRGVVFAAVAVVGSRGLVPSARRRAPGRLAVEGAEEGTRNEAEWEAEYDFIMSDYDEYESDDDAFELAMISRGWSEEELLSGSAAPGAIEVTESLAATVVERGVGRFPGALRDSTASELRSFALATLDKALEDEDEDAFSSVLCGGSRFDLRLPLEGVVSEGLSEVLSAVGEDLTTLATNDAELWELAAFISLPGAPPQPLHSDTLFSEEPCLYTLLVALQDTPSKLGPTRFVECTHGDVGAHDEFDNRGSLAFLNERRATAAIVPTGDCVLYDGRTFHAGGANTSEDIRVLFYCTFRHPLADAETLSNLDAHSILPDLAKRKIHLRELIR